MTKPLILVTNDDGIHAPGLAALADALEPLGETWIYAPDRQQSAVGHAVSLERPLRVEELRARWYMVDGTPTDCVMLAIRDLLPRKPELVFSGINSGPNLGDDVTYSGTVAGAYEGMLLGARSVAISCASHMPKHFETAAAIATRVAQAALEHPFPPDTMLNVNVPDVPLDAIQGIAVTRMGQRHYEDEIVRRTDPRGRMYYWIGGSAPTHNAEPGTDLDVIEHNWVSVTPLQRDMTNHQALNELARWTWP